ncbi:hypothetical protein R5R35_009584 [Gryllus longicercus]|uniref:Uncharacterized protein n=1 Tax=Gryllus longicercus TaxID=2509291 RepID=A0AAN9VKX2_9ORTH
MPEGAQQRRLASPRLGGEGGGGGGGGGGERPRRASSARSGGAAGRASRLQAAAVNGRLAGAHVARPSVGSWGRLVSRGSCERGRPIEADVEEGAWSVTVADARVPSSTLLMCADADCSVCQCGSQRYRIGGDSPRPKSALPLLPSQPPPSSKPLTTATPLASAH